MNKFEKTMLFSLSTSNELVEKVAAILGMPKSDVIITRFEDEEQIVYPKDSVRGKNVFVVQSTSTPSSQNIMELLIFINALKLASAKEITAIIPYFGYARQDRKSQPRHPITARLVADILQTAGVNRVVSFDFHTPQLQGFFRIPSDNIPITKLITSYFEHLSGDDLVIISPDHGGVTRAQELATMLRATLAILDKRRSKPNSAEVANIIGDVKGKNCIILDDMIDTGGTILAGIKVLKEAGVKDIYVAATHAVFSADAITKLENSVVKEIVVTDTIPTIIKENSKIKIVSIATLLAKVIENVELGIPLSTIY